MLLYDEFIINEKKSSGKFLKTQQIPNNRFDDSEYNPIRHTFNDGKMINKTYEIIDLLIKEEKLDWEFRFIVIGDFLFAMGSFDIKDPSTLVWKISRSDYFRKILIRAEVNATLGYNFISYLKIHKKLLIGLRINNVIKKSIIRVMGDEWNTIVYFKLITQGDSQITSPSTTNFIGVSKFPFVIGLDNRYSIGSFRNVWKLKRKKKEMEDFKVCINSVTKANNIKFELNNEIYNINKKIIDDEISKTLKKTNCITIDEYFDEMIKIIDDDTYSYDLTINKKTKHEELIKNFQKLLSFKVLEKMISNKYYLPCFIDNRGRQYYATLLSPTFLTLFRYLYSFEKKNSLKGLYESIFYKKIIKNKELVKNFNLNDYESYIALVLLIEIGKFYIKTSGSCFTKTNDIIKAGLDNYEDEENLSFDDRLYVNKIKNNFNELITKKKIDINTIIFKDATASGLQNYGIVLGYKEDKLSYLNLDGDDWCDTYTYLIDKFLNNKTKFLKRAYWKNTIMTIPYNSVWFSCFKKFIEALEKDNIDYEGMGIEEKEKLTSIHKEFYNNIKNNVKKEFFKNDKAKLIEFKYSEWKIVNKKEYKINFKKSREKYTDVLYMIVEDEKSTQRALEANNMHYLDACLIKAIIADFDIISIHDCVGVRLCELHLVIDKINEYYSSKINKKIYGTHVLI